MKQRRIYTRKPKILRDFDENEKNLFLVVYPTVPEPEATKAPSAATTFAPGTLAPTTAPGAPTTAPGTLAPTTAPGTLAPTTAPGTNAPTAAPGIPTDRVEIANGVEELAVSESSNGKVTVVKGRPSIPGAIVVPMPRLKKMQAFFPSPGQVECTAEEASNHGPKLNSLITRDQKGDGTLIIIWDFFPTIPTIPDDLGASRPGGPIKMYNGDLASKDDHGIQCASMAGGMVSGVSTNSEIVLYGASGKTSDLLADLTDIEKMLELFKGPAVVSMSFALIFENLDEQSMREINKLAVTLNNAITNMKQRYPVLFFAASGNDSQTYCELPSFSNFQGCSNCYMWPVFTNTKDPFDSPVLLIGALDKETKLAAYSNFGSCVFGFSFGGPSCLAKTDNKFRPVQGTSFAAPLAAGIASLYMAQNKKASMDEVLRAMKGGARTMTDRDTTYSVFDFDSSRVANKQESTLRELPEILPEEVIASEPESLRTLRKTIFFGLTCLCLIALLVIRNRVSRNMFISLVAIFFAVAGFSFFFFL